MTSFKNNVAFLQITPLMTSGDLNFELSETNDQSNFILNSHKASNAVYHVSLSLLVSEISVGVEIIPSPATARPAGRPTTERVKMSLFLRSAKFSDRMLLSVLKNLPTDFAETFRNRVEWMTVRCRTF